MARYQGTFLIFWTEHCFIFYKSLECQRL